MISVVLVIVNEPLPRPAQSSKTCFVLLSLTPLPNRLPMLPCLLLIPDVYLQECGADVCRGRRQKHLPEKSTDGRSRIILKGLLKPVSLRKLAIPGIPQSFPYPRRSFGLCQSQPTVRSAGPVRVLFMKELRE